MNWSWGAADACSGLNQQQCELANKTETVNCAWYSCLNKCGYRSGDMAQVPEELCSRDCSSRSLENCNNDKRCKITFSCGVNGESVCVLSNDQGQYLIRDVFCPNYNHCASITNPDQCQQTEWCELSSCDKCKPKDWPDHIVCPNFKNP